MYLQNSETIPVFPIRTNNKLEEINIDDTEVQKLLEHVKKTKSPGPDELHPKFIKETAKVLTKPISILFRKSLAEGKLPDTWKVANITPIHKKGPKHEVNNYRPILVKSSNRTLFHSI